MCIRDRLERTDELGLTNIAFCPYIVRGLQYYTGIVFEMYDVGSKENPRSLFGGGRYDNLLEIFGEEKIPAFGLGWGDITTIEYLSTYSLIPKKSTDIDLSLIHILSSAARSAHFVCSGILSIDTNFLFFSP